MHVRRNKPGPDRAPEADFDAFVRTTASRLYRAAYLMAGDHHTAEDLTQTAYARAYVHWRRVSRADDPLAYTRTILLNSFLSHRRLRRSGEVPVDLTTSPLAERPGGTTQPDPATRLDLVDALATLSPLDRAVVVLRYWDDRSVADTARELGLTETTVRTRARRALQRLRPLVSDTSERTPS